ncbi:hypothetical protein ACF073_37910 [Streptomyces sp. NPDC015171]|uniref:hypothetical protein n=1 Tax=Streptomyces sp. NPDC015171 TaxID=3364945 RepID=UPI0037036A39
MAGASRDPPDRRERDTPGSQHSLGFDTDYYVTGEFPAGSGAGHWESGPDGRRVAAPACNLPPDKLLAAERAV